MSAPAANQYVGRGAQGKVQIYEGRGPWRVPRAFRLVGWASAALLALAPGMSRAQVVQISQLTDVGFGAITNLSADISQSQTVCAYSGAIPARYAITATGSGAGGAFTLSNGAAALAYEVQWNPSASQTSGTNLTAGSALTGQTSSGLTPTCTLGLTPSGSLTIILRAAALSSSHSGSFTGTLSLLLSPN